MSENHREAPQDGNNDRFPKTGPNTLADAVATGQGGKDARNRLCARYMNPLTLYAGDRLAKLGDPDARRDPHYVESLVNQFLVDVFGNDNKPGRLTNYRQRDNLPFRAFLKCILRRWLIDQHRKRTKGESGKLINLDQQDWWAVAPAESSDDDPRIDEEYYRLWAIRVADEAFTQADLHNRYVWLAAALESLSASEGKRKLDNQALARQFGLSDSAFRGQLADLRDHLRSSIRQSIRLETQYDPPDLEAAIDWVLYLAGWSGNRPKAKSAESESN